MRRENLTRVAVVMSWMQRRIQSLQKRSNFGFILERRIRRAFLPKRSPRVKLCVGLNEYLMEYPVHQGSPMTLLIKIWHRRYVKVVDLSKLSTCSCISCILRFLLQDDVNVYRSSPPLPDITRPTHLLPSAHLT